jgi:hypothetical protein
MADLTDLVRAVNTRAFDIVSAATAELRNELDRVVPVAPPDPLGRGRTGPRLKDTYTQSGPTGDQTGVSVTVGYSAPQALFSNDLMPRHYISPRRPGYPLRFMASDGTVVRTMLVDHPGNVNAESLGWFDKAVNAGTWSALLSRQAR